MCILRDTEIFMEKNKTLFTKTHRHNMHVALWLHLMEPERTVCTWHGRSKDVAVALSPCGLARVQRGRLDYCCTEGKRFTSGAQSSTGVEEELGCYILLPHFPTSAYRTITDDSVSRLRELRCAICLLSCVRGRELNRAPALVQNYINCESMKAHSESDLMTEHQNAASEGTEASPSRVYRDSQN